MSHSLNDTHDAGYLIYLESKDATILRDNGATAFFFLNKVISPSDPSMNLMVGVVDCEIPVSFYNINTNNNKITINSHEIILPLQNYSAFNIQDDINAQLLIASIPVSVDFSQQSNKFTFSPSSVGATIRFRRMHHRQVIYFINRLLYHYMLLVIFQHHQLS